MNGMIALLGSGEYLPIMDDVDRYLLANCGVDAQARKPRVVCLPTAAGREGDASVTRWSGREPFSMIATGVAASRPCCRSRSPIVASPATPM
jgi:hypothetical protein